MVSLRQWFSTGGEFLPPGIFGNVYRNAWFPQLGRCYQHLRVGARDAAQRRVVHRTARATKGHLFQSVGSAETEKRTLQLAHREVDTGAPVLASLSTTLHWKKVPLFRFLYILKWDI